MNDDTIKNYPGLGSLEAQYDYSDTSNKWELPKYDTKSLLSTKPVAKTSTLPSNGSMNLASNLDTDLAMFNDMDDAGKLAFAEAGGTIDGVSAKTMIPGGDSFDYIGAGKVGLGLGNLALGYMGYRDAKKTNELAREGAQFNLAQARKDAAATDKYRASYGV